jgi:hypothetical protein
VLEEELEEDELTKKVLKDALDAFIKCAVDEVGLHLYLLLQVLL